MELICRFYWKNQVVKNKKQNLIKTSQKKHSKFFLVFLTVNRTGFNPSKTYKICVGLKPDLFLEIKFSNYLFLSFCVIQVLPGFELYCKITVGLRRNDREIENYNSEQMSWYVVKTLKILNFLSSIILYTIK